MATRERPLSPHLQVYRWQITMTMSILHRVTGVILVAGAFALAWWLMAVASGPGAYAIFSSFIGSWIGRLIVFGYTWALMHHLLDGAPSPIKVGVKGGDTLEIGFEKTGEATFKNVTLTGPADFVFEGEIEIDDD